ncbi:hypothetical protein BDA99DRAFT_565151 [Phascolomyces articulosus]|uniref:DUF6729 domain-containing protein n=1 Tax=Phascolomyces articulosus TaxID=60185 RepID=A0AAD5P882_9FUNG|nr:hypothetical protein BDA99DRAFT_565151 [Phascolomyces articulosus]
METESNTDTTSTTITTSQTPRPQQPQQQQPQQQHEETIDAIAAAAPVDDEDGPALANYFRELQLELTKQMHESESRLPKCYEEGTFWITPPNAFFTLWKHNKKPGAAIGNTTTSSATTGTTITPGSSTTAQNKEKNNKNDKDTTDLTDTNTTSNNNPTTTTAVNNKKSNDHTELLSMKRPRVFVWLVHLLVDILQCPSEGCHLKKLQSHGWATAPCARRILDLHSDFYLMSYRYKCTHCKRTFFGHDQAIRDALPTPLAEEFPAVLSHRSGISRSTLELMQSCSTSAIGPFTRILKEHHALRSARLKLQYLAAKKDSSIATGSLDQSNISSSSSTTTTNSTSNKKRRIITTASTNTPSSSSSSLSTATTTNNAVVPAAIATVAQIHHSHQHRPSIPPPIAPRPPQPTPVFLPQPIFAMHPHLVALQHQQQQQLQPTSSSQHPPAIVPQAIPLQPIFYIRPETARPNRLPIHALKKPRKPRTLLKKPN